MDGYHALLSMHAYALQECGDYHHAGVTAQRALALEPRDVRAHHAAIHVMEMQGRFEEGVRWMARAARYGPARGRRRHICGGISRCFTSSSDARHNASPSTTTACRATRCRS